MICKTDPQGTSMVEETRREAGIRIVTRSSPGILSTGF